ncbi:class I SAM-dependent methyltransferase [Brevibacterium litoralis]|uniref:class I SAM-dependent methyltransferase n=1 Tax=Brevibacterium litoralis TaxID=3138935 RepID=UPI0032F05EE8
MTYDHQWARMRAADPGHSDRYARRWVDLVESGKDIDGEARLVDALAPRGAAILDAGCGQGRTGGYLAARGHHVVGVDLDDVLIGHARRAFPRAAWYVRDLAALEPDLVPAGATGFDLIVSAGNVLTFLDPAARVPALTRLVGLLAPGGRLITGFGAGRDYDFAAYADDLATAGARIDARWSTWNAHPFEADSDFLVCLSSADTDRAPDTPTDATTTGATPEAV